MTAEEAVHVEAGSLWESERLLLRSAVNLKVPWKTKSSFTQRLKPITLSVKKWAHKSFIDITHFDNISIMFIPRYAYQGW